MNALVIDIHTHRHDADASAIVSFNPWEYVARTGCLCSVGIHPWNANSATAADFDRLEQLARHHDVAIIGECGIDKLRGGYLQGQVEMVKRHAMLSEAVCKPLLLHCVRASNELCQLRRTLKPVQPWVVHGFRGNARVARQLLDAGFYLSYGQYFNPEAVRITPIDRLLVETDESPLPIEEICALVALNRGDDVAALAAAVASNATSLINISLVQHIRC